MNPLHHIYYKCPKPCRNQDSGNCMFCDGGLGHCIVCGGFEGQLLTYCPGYKLSEETLESCYRGNVLDFYYRSQMIKFRRSRLDKGW